MSLAAVQQEELLAIETRGLHKAFGSHQVLAGCDLRIPEGTMSVILGPSGTGKSVLLKHVIGVMQPDEGEVLVRGHRVDAMKAKDLLLLRRDVGVMFQDGALFSSMTVYDNVAFPLRQHSDLNEGEVRELVMSQLRSVGLEKAAPTYPSSLSGGMRKRAGLARALILEPRVLLCDEPDSGLDPIRTALLGELLAERHQELGGTIVTVTHNIGLAKIVGEHVTVVYEGRVREAGPGGRVRASDDPFIQQFLAGASEGPLTMN